MAKLNLENVWQIMKKYDFNKGNEIENDLLCTLCKKILINAHISPCTCRFCFDCISNYLNKEKKACPGNTDECKMELICLNDNILIDYAINNKVSKLIVKCPEKSCEFKDELKNIENHIRICNYRSVCCPYLNIGCNSSNMHAGNVIDHLQSEIGNHTKLLVDCINNLSNEIGRLKTSVDNLGEENKMLQCVINEMKLDGERKQTEIDKLNKKLPEMESKFEIESNAKIEEEFTKLKLDGERKQVDRLNVDNLFIFQQELDRKCEEQTGKIDLLTEEIVKSRNVYKYMREDVDKLKMDGERNKVKCDEQDREIDLLNEDMVTLRNVDQYTREDLDKLKLDGERNKEELDRKCEEQTGKIDLLNEEIVKLRNVDKCTREDVDKLKLDGERNKKSIGALEKKCEQQNKQIEQIENKFANGKQERENKEKDLMRNIDQMKNKQTEMSTMSNKIDQTVKNVENELLKIEINQNKMNYGEFVWRIDKINDKMKDAKNGINIRIYSDSFYTHKHGYKMCLCVYPDGDLGGKGTHLSVFFYLMRGEFDDILQWPFKYDVTFSLINQQTGLAHVSGTAKYDKFPNDQSYKKPINERNDRAMGFPKFIELKELSTNANLIFNNQIVIKCSVNIPS